MGSNFRFGMRFIHWLPLILAIIFMLRGADCERVQFFENEEYGHFLKSFDMTGDALTKCHDLSTGLRVGSLKTNRCIMLFGGKGCKVLRDDKFYDYSVPVKADTPKFSDLEFSPDIQSFQVCSREVGAGPEVDVDFYSKSSYLLNEGAEVTKFRDVCGCRNLEKSFVGGNGELISVDNWGHGIDMFEEEHCTGQMRSLRAGVSLASTYLWPPNDELEVFNVQSFRPSDYISCIKLHAEIYKFEFRNGTQEMMENSEAENVKLVTDSILRSNGAASLQQEFSVSGTVKESLEYVTEKGFSNMDSYGGSASLETTVQAGVPLLVNGEIKAEITAKYEKTTSNTGANKNKTSFAKEEVITARQQISIPPCTECVVSTFVKKVKNFPIAYTVYSRVTGSGSGDKMRAEDVRAALRPEAEYLGDFDEETVEVKIEGVMFAEFGLSTFIDADCKPIKNCKMSLKGAVLGDKEFKLKFEAPIEKSA